MKKIKFVIPFVLLLFFKTATAQWDAGMWNTLDASYRLNKSFAIVFTEECRLRSNFAELNLFYTNIGLEYKLNSAIKTSLVYRHIDKNVVGDKFTGISFRHRLMWDASYKYPITNKFSITYRHRLQVENRNILTSDNGKILEWYSRNKFSLKYNLTARIVPFASVEFRYQIHDRRSLESEHTWHRDRYAAGFEYEFSHTFTGGLYWLIQREYNVNMPENLSILGVELSVSLGKESTPASKEPLPAKQP